MPAKTLSPSVPRLPSSCRCCSSATRWSPTTSSSPGSAATSPRCPRPPRPTLSGEAATQIDTYYKKIMPHRTPSIDVMGAARYAIFKEGRPGVVVGNDGWLFSKEEFAAPLDRTPDLAEAATGVAEIRDELKQPRASTSWWCRCPPRPISIASTSVDAAIPTDLVRLYDDFRALLDKEGDQVVSTRAQPLLEAKPRASCSSPPTPTGRRLAPRWRRLRWASARRKARRLHHFASHRRP